MSYYMARTVEGPFDTVVKRVREALAAEGFGVISDIDVKAIMASKLHRGFRNYRILGACNPAFAHEALIADDKVGVMLPCNVIVQQTTNSHVEVAAIDPTVAMARIENPNLKELAEVVRRKLDAVIAQF